MPALRMPVSALATVVYLTSAAIAQQHDWPQWLGPNRDALTDETGLLKEWPEGGPPVAWHVESVGFGYAGPSIAQGKIYMLGSLDEVTHLLALDESNGDVLWKAKIGDDYKNGWGDGPRSTPTVDGDRVYAMAATGTLICCNSDTGDELWRAAMQDLGGSIPQWGYAESPLVDGDKVICTPGGQRGTMAALNKMTGELIWQSEGITAGAQYASAIKISPGGVDQYVQLVQPHVFSIKADDGSVAWQQDWPGRVAVIPTPVARDNKVYISSGYGVGCRLIELATSGTEVKETVYDNKVMKSKHDGLVLLGEYIYGYSDGGGWTCQNFETGERVWNEKGKLSKGSIGYADGMLYCMSEKEGEVVLIDATPEGWQEHGRFTLTPQTEHRNPKGAIWCYPVIANGKLFLRDQEHFFAFDVKANP